MSTRTDLVDRHFPRGFLAGLRDALGPGATFDDLRPVRKQMADPLMDRAMGFLEDMKAAGELTACPNIGSRGVRSMTAWNAWLADEDYFWSSAIAETPAMRIVQDGIIQPMVLHKIRIEKEMSPDGRIDPNDRTPVALDEETLDRVIEEAETAIRESYIAGTAQPGAVSTGIDYQCHQTGGRLGATEDLYAPVLTRFDMEAGKYGAFVIAEELEAPKPVRHVEMDMPSGQLVMADFIRVPGFKDALDAIEEDKTRWGFFDLNCTDGQDQRAEAYFREAGILIVQLGNTSPAAYRDTDGVIRMGRVDEDHDAFWTEDDERTDLAMPEEAWSTCTDLWANVFADKEVVIDVMMRGADYESREAAARVLEDYCEETFGATIADIGPGPLHVYMPTGNANRTFEKAFRVTEFESPDWREDTYVLSRAPLTVTDPDIVEEAGWTAPARETEDCPEP